MCSKYDEIFIEQWRVVYQEYEQPRYRSSELFESKCWIFFGLHFPYLCESKLRHWNYYTDFEIYYPVTFFRVSFQSNQVLNQLQKTILALKSPTGPSGPPVGVFQTRTDQVLAFWKWNYWNGDNVMCEANSLVLCVQGGGKYNISFNSLRALFHFWSRIEISNRPCSIPNFST